MFVSLNLKASETFANDIQNRIKQLDETHQITGRIVDLRGNQGGTMHPMIKGLSCLIGDCVCGYIIYPKQEKELPISPIIGNMGMIKLTESYKIKNASCKIAILIDAHTASSGEFTAIALKSFPRSRFFGQPSAGYTTSNFSFPLSDGSYLFLATGYMADRKRNTYLPSITPDVLTIAKTNNNLDPTMEAAKIWLAEE